MPFIGGLAKTQSLDIGYVITVKQAETFLLDDVKAAVDEVNCLVTVAIDQEIFDALVNFAFNCGVGALTGSTLLRDLNAGDMDAAAEQFEAWDHAAGKVVAGLLQRRIAERDEFLSVARINLSI